MSVSPDSQDRGLINLTPIKKRADSIESAKLTAVGTAIALTVSSVSKAPIPPIMENTVADSNRESSICTGNGEPVPGAIASSNPLNNSTPNAWEMAAAQTTDNNLLAI